MGYFLIGVVKRSEMGVFCQSLTLFGNAEPKICPETEVILRIFPLYLIWKTGLYLLLLSTLMGVHLAFCPRKWATDLATDGFSATIKAIFIIFKK